ncbi:A/G-specific adenine glycosylase [Candidatus Uhrbacteria bacterium]|nr:A/G-specific adenine glycosylase [Candidatus Uhrbacteria bacterium]
MLRWYAAHKRDLPWRRTRDPYRILVSEIMLQQTQVDRVIPKYKAFLKEFPTLRALADASPAAVIRAWSGLGYNRRALYLHRTAQSIAKDYHGRFPKDVDILETLPGIGKYTARAVVCFAFGKDVAPVDTNIARVFHRIFFGVEVPKKKISDAQLWTLAEKLVPKGRGYPWNHGLMDFGSLVCTAKRPKCVTCPMQSKCAAYPAIKSVDWTKHRHRTVAAFKDSDRYFRGRIIEYLRTAPGHRSTIAALEFYFRAQCPPSRLSSLIDTLVRDHLVTCVRDMIALPR